MDDKETAEIVNRIHDEMRSGIHRDDVGADIGKPLPPRHLRIIGDDTGGSQALQPLRQLQSGRAADKLA